MSPEIGTRVRETCLKSRLRRFGESVGYEGIGVTMSHLEFRLQPVDDFHMLVALSLLNQRKPMLDRLSVLFSMDGK